jgi:hypothetical protein
MSIHAVGTPREINYPKTCDVAAGSESLRRKPLKEEERRRTDEGKKLSPGCD